MLYLISAPPRTGKTLRAIKIIFERLNEGRIVYTNIVGIKIDGVICVNSTIDNPFDWRDLPNDSVVIWDEAHEHPAFADRNLIQDKQKMLKIRDIGTSLLLHGHFGFDIYLITQKPNLLHADVLAAVSTHYVMRRKFGFDAATIWEFGEAITTWSKSAADSALVKTYWKYPKHLYKFYVSSEKHNVKKTFPLKYAAFACIPILIFGLATKNATNTGFFGLFGKKEQQQQTAQQSQNQNKPTNPDISQDIQTKIDQCMAQLNWTFEQCRVTYDPAYDQKKKDELLAQTKNDMNSIVVAYDPSQPYKKMEVQYQATTQPVFSGCVKKNGKYVAYTQQGTILHDVNQNDCKRLIEDGDRPFNYFAQGQQNGLNNSSNITTNNQVSGQQNTTQAVPKMTAEQYARYIQYLEDQNQANNQVQRGLEHNFLVPEPYRHFN
ncbi:zonular occludens toxin domain-containing protein [Acinetobacter soli]|uniref:zonular occludens toxin domain-containing protein n=1 Tax=Acinetobacter soli TaxID=487316 RepID=UPI0012305704|nr:zonular occludens toxin domain-containing protein [Acinetobacter soli]